MTQYRGRGWGCPKVLLETIKTIVAKGGWGEWLGLGLYIEDLSKKDIKLDKWFDRCQEWLKVLTKMRSHLRAFDLKMDQNTNEWKFRTKRERQRLLPYSRPISDSRNERIHNLNINTNNTNINDNDINNTNSLLSRISMSVKDFLIPNWLRNTTNLITLNTNNDNNINNSNTSNSDSNSNSNEILQNGSNININDGLNANLWDSSQRLRPFNENWVQLKSNVTEVNPNDYLSKPSTSNSTPMFTATDSLRQSTSSFINQNKQQDMDGIEADDRSSSSSATASSTSGCSSLVPSHSENVLRLGLPLEAMRKELAKMKNRESMSGSDSTLNKAVFVSEKRLNSAINTNKNNNNNNNNSNVITKQFNVRNFLSPSSVLPQKSHFYEGKTVYGGANVSRAARLAGTTPYNLSSRHCLAPVMRVNVNNSRRIDANDQLSTSTKKIFEKLEKASTPLQDAKRLTLYELQQKSYFQSQQMVGSIKRPKFGPSIGSVLTPSKAMIDNRNKPIKWELTPVLNKDKKTSNNDNICDKNSLIDSKRDKLIANKVNTTEGGGKIMRNDKKINNDPQDESIENSLSNVTPLTIPSGISLPKFNFGNSVSFQKQSSANKALPTTTLTKVEDESMFKFSSPTLRKSEKKIQLINKSEPTVSTPFTFSSPKGVITQIPSLQLKTTESVSTKPLKTNQLKPQLSDHNISSQNTKVEHEIRLDSSKSEDEKWICGCLYYNNFGQNKCKACHKERGSQSSQPMVAPKASPMPSWGDKFKAPSGSWNCPICMINNNSDKTKCAACETPKPGLSDTLTPKDGMKPSPDLWQCYYCQNDNEISKTSCVKCKKVKTPIASKEELDKLYSPQTFNFGFNEKINDNNKDVNQNSTETTTTTFSKSSESLPQINTTNSTPFTFGSTIIAKEKTVQPKATTTQAEEHVFKFGLTSKPTELTTTVDTDKFSSNKTSGLYQFGTQTTTTATTNVTPTAPEFGFGIGIKPNEANELTTTLNTDKSFNKTSGLFQFGAQTTGTTTATTNMTTNMTTTAPEFGFGIGTKPKEVNELNTTLNTNKFLSNKTSSLYQFGAQTTTTATTNMTTNVTPTAPEFSFGIATKPKEVKELKTTLNTDKSSNKTSGLFQFGAQTTTTATTNMTTTAPEFGFAIGTKPKEVNELNPSLSTNKFPSTKTSGLYKFGAQTSNVTTTAPEFGFGIGTKPKEVNELNPSLNADKFASNKTSGLFQFGAQTTATTIAPEFGFGIKPKEANELNTTLNTDKFSTKTSGLFQFGAQTTTAATTSMTTNMTTTAPEFSFGLNTKPKEVNERQKSVFSFGANPSTGQNHMNIFGNALNSSQNSLSFTQQSSVNNNTPFSFGFGSTQSTPSVPPIQAPPPQPLMQAPPPFDFTPSQPPSFNFANIYSNPSQASPVFQFSAEQTTQQQSQPLTSNHNRSIKKAKRRLNPT